MKGSQRRRPLGLTSRLLEESQVSAAQEAQTPSSAEVTGFGDGPGVGGGGGEGGRTAAWGSVM